MNMHVIKLSESRSVRVGRGLAVLFVLAAVALLAGHASAAPPSTLCTPGEVVEDGQCDVPVAVAVDQGANPGAEHIYVGEQNGRRVQEFDGAGNFERAFGWGVLDDAEELQTCSEAASCRIGLFSSGTKGGFGGHIQLALDQATHALYLSDPEGSRIEKYDTSGEEVKFVLMFGNQVDKTRVHEREEEEANAEPVTVTPEEENLCTAASGDECGAGVPGAGPGQFAPSGAPAPLAVDASGNVWVGDEGRVEKFNSAGEFLSQVAIPGVIASLAVDSVGDLYVRSGALVGGGIENDIPGVRKYDPAGNLVAGWGTAGVVDESGQPEALALDPATGDLFVSDHLEPGGEPPGPAVLLQFNAAGEQIAAFGIGEVIGNPQNDALAVGDLADGLYVAGNQAVQRFPLPSPGPLVLDGSSETTDVTKSAATLNAQIDPEGARTTFHFQYVDDEHFEKEGGFSSPQTLETAESTSIGEDFEAHRASAEITNLPPDTAYHYRVVATNECEPVAHPGVECVTDGETAEFETEPPAAIDSTSASDVTAEGATLEAEINPLGDPTSYRFEFLPEAQYLGNIGAGLSPFTGATQVPVFPASIGTGAADVAVSQELHGLLPHTAYRYRAVVLNAISEAHGGPFGGPVRTFITQAPGGSVLIDGRQWELVSPADKQGALIVHPGLSGIIEAAANTPAITYLANAPTEASPSGYTNQQQVLSSRGSLGWSTHDLSLPHLQQTGLTVNQGLEYRYFSPDLTSAIVQPFGGTPLLSAEASEATAYLQKLPCPSSDPLALFQSGSCFRPLVSGKDGYANVLPGTVFGISEEEEASTCPPSLFCGPRFEGSSKDAHATVVGSDVPLTAGAPSEGLNGLYESTGGQLKFISRLPVDEGSASSAGTLGSVQANPLTRGGADARNAISEDGSRVFWTSPSQHLYLRDLGRDETIRLDLPEAGLPEGPGEAQFQGASPDGTRAWFLDSTALVRGAGARENLYECQIAPRIDGSLACNLHDLTPRNPATRGVVGSVIGMSGEACDVGRSADCNVYFVSDGAYDSASPGDCGQVSRSISHCNLYLVHNGGSPRLIAVLSGEDASDWGTEETNDLEFMLASVSPDGRWLDFMSDRSLTGYDNRDARSGVPVEETYVYGAQTGQLDCVSCDPNGARPVSVEAGPQDSNVRLVSPVETWPSSTMLASTLPTWETYSVSGARYQPRTVTDDGRVFFDAFGALAPRDTNGQWDVYEYEPEGLGGCSPDAGNGVVTHRAARSFAVEGRTGEEGSGCVGLISSGTSPHETAFLDANEGGGDVFFLGAAQLASQDVDHAYDVYDAHQCTGESPCPPPPPPPQPACEGDACQQPATAPTDATPGSLTFQGAGNLLECPKGRVERGGRCVAKKHRKAHKRHRRAHKGARRAAHKRVAKTNRRAGR